MFLVCNIDSRNGVSAHTDMKLVCVRVQDCAVARCGVFTCSVFVRRDDSLLYSISGNISSGWIEQVTQLQSLQEYIVRYTCWFHRSCYSSLSQPWSSGTPVLHVLDVSLLQHT